ncbi:hypothetical protein [Streptomyces longisporoflavus]|uniref:Uncharacterized protein n=1 Tax=Streptomyces longisporoflavus TaxID=28044 RepID=A0ABW7QGT5_9ACTN
MPLEPLRGCRWGGPDEDVRRLPSRRATPHRCDSESVTVEVTSTAGSRALLDDAAFEEVREAGKR